MSGRDIIMGRCRASLVIIVMIAGETSSLKSARPSFVETDRVLSPPFGRSQPKIMDRTAPSSQYVTDKCPYLSLDWRVIGSDHRHTAGSIRIWVTLKANALLKDFRKATREPPPRGDPAEYLQDRRLRMVLFLLRPECIP
jgi:hypothetical protein